VTSDLVQLRFDGPVARLTLNRPAVGNALDLATATEFAAAVHSIARREPKPRLVVLTGAGRMFCVGGDVGAMADSADPSVFVGELATRFHGALVELRSIVSPVLAVVHGTVAGGGLGLVLAADIVVAAEEARFVAAYAGVGLSPDSGVSALLPAVLGVRRTALFLLTNRSLTASEALGWGLVSEVVSLASLPDRAAALERALLDKPGPALGETARLLRQAAERPYAVQLADEASTIARMRGSEESETLMEAFLSGQRVKRS
jgi:2-(1,2-epoxy-1,2-dihydrophenyl)acetyl-CoA isomerase